MKSKRKLGVVRRPVEYFLTFFLVALVAVLVLSVYSTNQADKKINYQPPKPYAPNGTVKEMAVISDKDIIGEKNINSNIRRAEISAYDTIDSSINKVLNVYNEESNNLDKCEAISSSSQRLIGSMNDKISNLDSELASDIEKNKEKRMKQDESIASWRAKQDITRSDSYNLINQKFLGHLDPSYATEIDSQVSARRSSFDSARTDFRSQIDSTVTVSHEQLKTDARQFATEFEQLLNQVSQACELNEESVAIQELNTALKTLESVYRPKLKSSYAEAISTEYDKFKDKIKVATAEFEKASSETMSEFSYLDR